VSLAVGGLRGDRDGDDRGGLLGALAGMRGKLDGPSCSWASTDAIRGDASFGHRCLAAALMHHAGGDRRRRWRSRCTQWTGVFRGVRAEALRLRSSAITIVRAWRWAPGCGIDVRWHLLPQPAAGA
jgi:hypothetical protein